MNLRDCFAFAALLGLLGCTQPAPEPQQAKPAEEPALGTVVRVDPALDAIVPANARIEKLVGGFAFTEGPVWDRQVGGLLFSDIPQNVIHKWTPDGQVTIFRKPAGYDGSDAPTGAFIGSNGLTLDRQQRLIICEHGNRRLTRLEPDGKLTVLAAAYQGKRLNSPNDAVCKSDGSVYFTDPPYGLVKLNDDPKKELDFNGVYRFKDGKLDVLHRELTFPNGLAFAPDEQHLYVANSDPSKKIWMKFEVQSDDSLGPPSLFFDASSSTEEGLPDGMKVDSAGNLYCTGPGGVWIFSPAGKHLGTIKPPEVPANCHWGPYTQKDPAGQIQTSAEWNTLYMTARTGLYRIRLSIEGIHP